MNGFKGIVLKISLGFAIGSFMINILYSMGIIVQESEMYFGYSTYYKQKIKLDTLIHSGSDRTGTSITYFGFTKNKYQKVVFFSPTRRSGEYLHKYFNSEAEDFKGNVFVLKSNKYDKIYFYESRIAKLSFFSLWRPRIIDVIIFLCFYLNLLFWYNTFKKELLKYNLTVSQFNKMDKISLEKYLQQFKNKES